MSKGDVRTELLIFIGNGDEGKALRKRFDTAAKVAGLKVTDWARKVLMQAAGSSGACVCGAPRDAADPQMSGIYQLYCCRSCGTVYSKMKGSK